MKLTAKTIPTADIYVRPNRQRKKITDEEIQALASIIPEPDGLYHPITVAEDPSGPKPYVLIAGERRLRAFQWWEKAGSPEWANIPCRVAEEPVSVEESQIHELLENLSRKDLAWQEECEAVLRIYEAELAEDPDIGFAAIAGLLEVSDTFVRQRVKVARALREDNPLIAEATSARAANAALDRATKREVSKELVTFDTAQVVAASGDKMDEFDIDIDLGGMSPADEDATKVAKSPEKISATTRFEILNTSFIDWVDHEVDVTRAWPPFNFVHCDFPYGINLDKSAQMNVSAFEGSYEDDDATYWRLCEHLIQAAKAGILAPSCHIMFWFPMSKYEDTRQLFLRNGFHVDPYPLVWHKKDRSGIVPDAMRGPRRTYETAFLMSLGDRKIIKPTAGSLSFDSERKSKDHASQKPWIMLSEFLTMFIDGDSVVLDPTCGSGTALAACLRKHAKLVVGLDIDPTSCEIAETNCHSAIAHMLYGAKKETADE